MEHPRPRAVVALVISNLEFGGAERQVVELANNLDATRFEVHIVVLSDYVPLAAKLHRKRIQLHVVSKRNKYDVSVVFRLRNLFRSLGVDIVQAFLFDAEIASRISSRLAGVRVIIGSERNSGYRISPLKRILLRLTAPLTDYCIANSSAGAEYNRTLYRQPSSKYRVIRNGVDTRRFGPGSQVVARDALGIRQDIYCVGIFGSFKAQKNHQLFFRMAAQLTAIHPETVFLIVGDSLDGGQRDSVSHKAELLRLIKELDVETNCLFLGNRSDVETIYPACDVTVLPSLHEGTPNVALESMASQVPVIVSDVSDNRYVVKDGHVGYVVPPDDLDALVERVAQLCANRELAKQLGENARRWIDERFSNERLAQNFASVYEEMLQAKSVGRRPGKQMMSGEHDA
jgi:glycosyltransferase involved in cell wall biosynthesis